MKYPAEFTLYDGDTAFRVRYDYNKGEPQWFDARAGVGSPGYDPYVEITEVNFGKVWELPDAYPQLNLSACEAEVMQKLADIDEAEMAEYHERNAVRWGD